MNMKLSTAIQDGTGSWTATTRWILHKRSDDKATLEKGSLLLLKRSVKQGPVAIDLDFAGNKAAGKMSMNGQDRPIAVDLAAHVCRCCRFGSGHRLPATGEGYNTTFRTSMYRLRR